MSKPTVRELLGEIKSWGIDTPLEVEQLAARVERVLGHLASARRKNYASVSIYDIERFLDGQL